MVKKPLKTLLILWKRYCLMGSVDKVCLIDAFHFWDQVYSDKVEHAHIQQHPTVNFSIEDTTWDNVIKL